MEINGHEFFKPGKGHGGGKGRSDKNTLQWGID